MDRIRYLIKRVTHRDIQEQFLRFAMVGGTAFFIDLGILRLVTAYGVGPYLGRVFSVIPAMIFGFLMNRRFTFRYDGPQRKRVQLPKYALVQVVGGLINYLIYAGFITYAPLYSKIEILGMPIKLIIGVAAGAGCAMFWNYAMARQVVFRDKEVMSDTDVG